MLTASATPSCASLARGYKHISPSEMSRQLFFFVNEQKGDNHFLYGKPGAKLKSFIQSNQHAQVTAATYSSNGSNLSE